MNTKKIINVVAGFIYKDKKFLICRRPAGKARALLWEFAGGKVEPGETHAEALKREYREELAVEIEVGGLFYEHSHEYDDVIVNLFIYHAQIVSGTIQKMEHKDIKWIQSGDIDQYEFCPADKEVLEIIKQNY